MNETVGLAGALAVAIGLVEVVKVLVNKRGANGKGTGLPCPAAMEHGSTLRGIEKIVTRVDAEGSPLIYGATGHRELLSELKVISGILKKIEVNGKGP